MIAILLLALTAAVTLLTGCGVVRFALAFGAALLGEALCLGVIHLLPGKRPSTTEFAIGSAGAGAGILVVEWLGGQPLKAAISQAAWAEMSSVAAFYAWALGDFFTRPGFNPIPSHSTVELALLALAIASSGVLGYWLAG